MRHATDHEKYLGSDEVWNLAETALTTALNEYGLEYVRMEDEAAFYGPKIDFKVVDAIKRTWQLSTIQVDFNLLDHRWRQGHGFSEESNNVRIRELWTL